MLYPDLIIIYEKNILNENISAAENIKFIRKNNDEINIETISFYFERIMLEIYLKSENRLFLKYHEEIAAYTFDNILEVINDIKNKYGIKRKVSLILDFSRFYISFFEAPSSNSKEEQNLLKSFLSDEIENYSIKNFITKQFYLDHPLRKSLVFVSEEILLPILLLC